ncbi:diguanylate cyclase/phosphodiesterase (GGDEF & EAL domains) with PAS/PAC sensor(s) [Indibacter alkaliphilus LW1]|uniref:histidine kinase n=1 Tax=Indibacter alkaliphilus (strain CCUG 57479 / KCTC 22604 / LW1) TaxID=1189612 RepID=S2E0K1_INDAL|nr:PAS domain S-box protein [Indibacter alkaliphilus]EOZ95558.1 diguanylate cyclase/phosphodiesterase (GGDEF & EAL domains) with PAS/PAC sensor(s) [Indibacter alkaliphilus LW1]
MAYFEKLDISVFSFFDEVQEPMMVFGEDQIVFVNKYWLDNFFFGFNRWQEFVNSGASQNELYRFFLSGEMPKLDFLRTLKNKDGILQKFHWSFVNLSSNTDIRYCLAKGKQQISLSAFMGTNAQQSLMLESQQELGFVKTIMRNSHDILVIIDEEGVFKSVSSAAIDKLGTKPERVIGKSLEDFIAEGVIEFVNGDFESLKQAEDEVQIDLWITKADGNRIFLESYAKNLVNEPSIEGYLISAREVTDYYLAKKSLQKRYELEILINQISARFVNADIHRLDAIFNLSLKMLGDFEKADRAYLFLVHDDLQILEYAYEWTNDGIDPQMPYVKTIPIDEDAMTMQELRKGEILIIPDVDLMEERFSLEKEVYQQQGIKSVILIPIFSENRLIGFFGLDAVKQKRDWFEKDEYVLRQLGDIYAGSLINRAIRKSLERNERLLESTEILAKSGSWRLSESKNRIYFSKGFNKIFDINEGESSANPKELLKRLKDDHIQEILQNAKLAKAKKTTTSGEFSIVTAEGKEKHIDYSIHVKESDSLGKLEVYGYCSDITHKRDAENYLKLQSQILAQVDDPIFVTDNNWNILYMNRAAKNECKIKNTEFFNGKIFDLFEFLSSENVNVKKSLEKLKLTKVYKKELNLKSRDGLVQPYEVSVQAFMNDEQIKIGYSFVIRNLSFLHRQEALAKRAKMVVENSPAVLFTVDPNDNFKFVYVSENIRQFGYDADELTQKGTSIMDLIHPDDAEDLIEEHFSNRKKEGIPAYSGEYRLKKKDGTYRWVEDKSSEILDESGNILLHEGLIQDVTERKRTREEIIRSQNRYRVLASNIPLTSVFLIDRDLKYIVAEGTTLSAWGMTSKDFEGKTLKEVHKTNLKEIQPAVTRALLLKEIVQKNMVYKRRVYEMTIRPIFYGGEVEYALGILRDINEEYEAKVNLKKNEEKYRKLVEESTEIIYSMNLDLEFTYVSPNVKQFLGYEVEEVIQRNLQEFVFHDDSKALAEFERDKIKFLEENQYLEFKLRRKDGESRVFSSNGRLIRSEEGEVYYNGIARDITKLRRAQKELLLAKEKAEQASMVKSQFLSIMSHEIRTPMNAVIGMSHLLLEENPRPDQMENLKTLQFSAENLLGLINDILDYTKIDSGKVELESVAFELKTVVNRIIHSYSYQAREKSLDIQFVYDERIPDKILGDPVRLGQVINNLISNAVKFTEKGFVRIGVELLEDSSKKIKLNFKFEDTGIGIPKEKLDSIFEAFTQASAETTRKFGGTGLGLAIVKRLVNLFDSEIYALKREGGGSIFTFAIDFDKIDHNRSEVLKPGNGLSKNLERASILVAEDNLVNQIMIKKFLKKWGVGEIVIAEDGLQAISEFDRGQFHLVLLDLQMPHVDGFEVAEHIRNSNEPKKKSTPVIALTASSLIDVKDQLEEVGMDDFISKPFNPDNLYSKIIKHLKL